MARWVQGRGKREEGIYSGPRILGQMTRRWRIQALRQSWVGGEDFHLGNIVSEARKEYPGGGK